MEHPGASPSPIQGKPILYGTVHGAVGENKHINFFLFKFHDLVPSFSCIDMLIYIIIQSSIQCRTSLN